MELAMTDLVPRARGRTPDLWSGDGAYFTLQREMNRLFDDTFRNFGVAPFSGGASGAAWPSVEVSETDKAVKVTAELAGLDEKDIELRVENNVLTLKGEKRTESQDKDKRYSERFYGRFERVLSLPSEVDDEHAEATFKNGVLSVTLPKTDRAREAAKRIPISKI
ncbi:MAG: Hsp20/alpha crystallin family protein [Proteobacteria bacterium]|nr:Hsp20/alpha crystallin family protein [Pseudomonadota bacterium]